MAELSVENLPDRGQAYSGAVNNEVPLTALAADDTIPNDLNTCILLVATGAASVTIQGSTTGNCCTAEQTITLADGEKTIIGPLSVRDWGSSITVSAAANASAFAFRPALG